MDYQPLYLLDGLPDDYEHWDEKLPEMPRGVSRSCMRLVCKIQMRTTISHSA